MSEPDNIAIFVNLILIKNSKKEVVIRNKIKRVDIDKNFDHILNEIYDPSLIDIESINVKVSSLLDLKEEALTDITEKLSFANELMKVKVISFETKVKQSQKVENVAPQRSMNDVLMRQSRLLETLKGSNKKVSLHKDLIRGMQENNLLCRNTRQEGHKLFQTLRNTL